MSPASTRRGAAPRARLRSWIRPVPVVLAALVACVAGPSAAHADAPQYDPFYAAPADLAAHAPGDVLRSRRVSVRTGPSIKLPYKAYQVLYRTTDRDESPSATVATIYIPVKRPKTGRRLVSYQTAYDGIGPGCRPSYSLTSGKVALQAVETLLIGSALDRGWTVVTSDYEGPKDQFGVGTTSGYATLDGIRAAERFPDTGLPEGERTPVGILGYSGGGQATAWAAELSSIYAPELNIVGAAQGGVGGDLSVVLNAFDGELFAGVGLAGIIGISNAYPDLDLDSLLNNTGRAAFKRMRSTASCITDYVLAFPFLKFRSLFKDPNQLKSAQFQAIAQENSLGKHAPKIPVLWYDTVFNQMGSHGANLKIARGYCEAGTKLAFRVSRTEEHAAQAFSWPLKAQAWISYRFNGAPLDTDCGNLR